MINSRMWLVVNPTVGLPIFLGAVAVGSFSVHVGIVTNTTWVNDFLSGRKMGSTDKMASIDGAQVVLERSTTGEPTSGLVSLPDGRTGKIVFDDNKLVKTASLD
ncbi:MAG: light-harvesting protein [Pseudomonadota bacterium]